MDLTPLQRKAAFAVIVLALAGLGAFLLFPGPTAAHGQSRSDQRASAPPRPAPTTPFPSVSPTPVPTSPVSSVDIYRWLPFSQRGLAAAAAIVLRFSTEYATWTYTQNAASYVAQMKGLITSQLSATLARGFQTPGVAQQRAQQKQSATGGGQITAIRAFGTSSLTFLVTVTQKITGSHGSSRQSTDYAVTVTGASANWLINDVELASQGNT
jgi:hypothetical protein